MGHCIMAIKRQYVNKLCVLIVLFLCLIGGGWGPPSAFGAEEFKIKPIEKAGDLRLMPAGAWPHPESEAGEMLLKLSYLRGLIDALQYMEIAPRNARQTLAKCAGMDLKQLAAQIDRYYLADPRRRELPPAAVIFRILPLAPEGLKHSAPAATPEQPAGPAK